MDQCGGMQDRTPDTSQGQRVVKDLLGVEARAKQVQAGSIVRTIRLHARRIKHRHASDGGCYTTEPIPPTDYVASAEVSRSRTGESGRRIRRYAHIAPVALGHRRRGTPARTGVVVEV